MRGSPAAGMDLRLYRLDPEQTLLVSTRTNADGRCDGPLLSGDDFITGRYRLDFAVGDYFAGVAAGNAGSDPAVPFLDRVPVDFLLEEDGGHYHVPLLVSPFSYTTYRGS